MGLFADKPGAKKGDVVFSNDKKTHPADAKKGIIANDYGQVHKNYLSRTQMDKVRGKTSYAVQIRDKGATYFINPEKTTDGVAIRANDAGMTANGWDPNRSKKLNQAVLEQVESNRTSNPNKKITNGRGESLDTVIVPRLALAAGKPGGRARVIKQGEEIFTHYTGSKNQDGGGYWTGEKRRREEESEEERTDPTRRKTRSGRRVKKTRRFEPS